MNWKLQLIINLNSRHEYVESRCPKLNIDFFYSNWDNCICRNFVVSVNCNGKLILNCWPRALKESWKSVLWKLDKLRCKLSTISSTIHYSITNVFWWWFKDLSCISTSEELQIKVLMNCFSCLVYNVTMCRHVIMKWCTVLLCVYWIVHQTIPWCNL